MFSVDSLSISRPTARSGARQACGDSICDPTWNATPCGDNPWSRAATISPTALSTSTPNLPSLGTSLRSRLAASLTMACEPGAAWASFFTSSSESNENCRTPAAYAREM
jgi:hypothetical protein